MKRLIGVISAALFLSVLTAAAQAPAQGQGGGQGAPPQRPTNLQILPKDWTINQVFAVMGGFNRDLGVECGHCHVYYGIGNPMNDEATDKIPAKEKARVMMRLTNTINATLKAQLSSPSAGKDITEVTCATCHRGVAVPRPLADIVFEAYQTGGSVAAGLAKYQELRKLHFPGPAYDFSDLTLFQVAQRANGANKPDDALAFAKANLEFNPMSARSHQVMSQAYVRKKDTPNALAELEKAVAMDPGNMVMKNQLEQLKKSSQR